MPRTKSEAQRVLRGFDIRGLKVETIEDDRIFALTGPILDPDGQMRRRARTIILREAGDGTIHCQYLKGWIVDDERDCWDPAW